MFVLALGFLVAACWGGTDDDERTETNSGEEASTADLDSDGIPDADDDDIDGDGFSNDAEGSEDTDGDGIPDDRDRDSDNDGRPDVDEAAGDTDGDGIEDRVDQDSDGDGVADGGDPSDDEDNSEAAIDDPDGDAVDAAVDNCPNVANNDQANNYGNGPDGSGSDSEGDACDDTDEDGTVDAADGCALDPDRVTAPCALPNNDETASCFGIEGSVDPDLIPVTALATGHGGGDAVPLGTAYFGAIPGVQGIFGACVPVDPGDGSPWFACVGAVTDVLAGAEVMGQFEGGLYLALQLEDGPPDDLTFDIGNCDSDDGGPGQAPVLQTSPDLTGIGEFAQTRFDGIDDLVLPTDPAELEPAEIADLSTEQQVELVDEALGQLTAAQITEIDDNVLVEVPAAEVAGLEPEVIVIMPVQVLEALETAVLLEALENDLSEVPDSYLTALTVAELEGVELAALATLDDRQIELLGTDEQILVEKLLEGFETP